MRLRIIDDDDRPAPREKPPQVRWSIKWLTLSPIALCTHSFVCTPLRVSPINHSAYIGYARNSKYQRVTLASHQNNNKKRRSKNHLTFRDSVSLVKYANNTVGAGCTPEWPHQSSQAGLWLLWRSESGAGAFKREWMNCRGDWRPNHSNWTRGIYGAET